MEVKQIKHDLLVHNLAVRLREGGIVMINGLPIRAKLVEGGEYWDSSELCNVCKMDCLCKNTIAQVCNELDKWSDKHYILDICC